ncbi:DUF47 family protein [Collinsella sp. zg1085]|uniref:DUF47 domain-containing protein n=1 Tax=Collinsella sp. zg1085 TaxID=2844380 RepID=UPI001C0E32AA|nr:DUF47 family protein [Collinsella sp. zg1085]QWT18053.1 DUF47 family protein [Collinsella sp. zg1085]
MAKKKDEFYFNNFIACADVARRAAHLLVGCMENFDPEKIDLALAQMHEIENEGDECNHEISDALVSAFITPMEREDIALLSERLDSVTDHLEGVLHRIYFCNIQEIRASALKMAHKILEACDSMKLLVGELPEFKRSKKLREQVVTINTIEGQCDELYIESMRELHTDMSLDPLTVIAWRDVYTFLEITADSVEDVAETVENVVMKNS